MFFLSVLKAAPEPLHGKGLPWTLIIYVELESNPLKERDFPDPDSPTIANNFAIF